MIQVIEKILNYDYKKLITGILVVATYFILSALEALPLQIAGININTMSNTVKVFYMIVYELLMISIIILLLNQKLKKDFHNILLHHKEYYSKYFKVYLIGLGIMYISNAFIIFILGNNVAGNESTIRSLFQISPLYIYLSAVCFAPIVEELVFRQGICNIFGRNYLFILISGLVFGGLHVIGNVQNISDLLYLIPYCSLGFAFAYMLYKTDNIFVSMGFHFFHNGILMAIQVLALFLS